MKMKKKIHIKKKYFNYFAKNIFFSGMLVIIFATSSFSKTVREEQLPLKTVEIYQNQTDWTNPDNIQGVPAEFFISQEGYLCKSQIAIFWKKGIQHAGRMCRMPDGAWRVLY